MHVNITNRVQAKQDKVKNLREMNGEAEKLKSFGKFMTEEFQRKYVFWSMFIT